MREKPRCLSVGRAELEDPLALKQSGEGADDQGSVAHHRSFDAHALNPPDARELDRAHVRRAKSLQLDPHIPEESIT